MNLGDTLTLDCDLAPAGVIFVYPVFWAREGTTIAFKNQNAEPEIIESHLSHSVHFNRQGRSWSLSLVLHRVGPYQAGEYKCFDDLNCQRAWHLCKTFHVSVITCNCSSTGVIADMNDDRVSVKCILDGYRSPRVRNISIIISPGGGTVQGIIVQEIYLITNVKAATLCTNLTLEFNLNPDFPSYRIQCPVPHIIPCPDHGPAAATSFQKDTPNTTGTIENHISASVTTGYEIIQHRTSLSSAPTTQKEIITYYTSSSPINKHILIASITVIIVSLIVAVVIVCLIRRRNERNHVPSCRKPGTKGQGEKAHPTSSVDGKRDQSVDLLNETSEKTELSGQAYYANFKGTNRAPYQEDDSRIYLSCTIGNDKITKPPTTQPFISTQINQGTESCSSHQIPVIQESSNPCSQYESEDVDFHGGIEAGDNMAGARVAYQELILGPIDLSSQYQPLHLYEGTRAADPFVRQKRFTQESGNSCSQYESEDVDFHGGIEAGDNMAERCAAYQELILSPNHLSSKYQPLHLYEGTGGADPFSPHQQQFTHESSAPLSQYEAMDLPSTTGETENGDTHIYAACDEKPPSEKEEIKMEESSKGSIDESGIHVYANLDKRPRYGRNTKP